MGKFKIEDIDFKKACFATGHRPDKLEGYNMYSAYYVKLKSALKSLLIRLIEEKDVKYFISGGALGWDILFFEVVDELKLDYDIYNIVAVPYEDQSSNWPYESRQHYKNDIIGKADLIVYVDKLPNYRTDYVPVGRHHDDKLTRRNELMVDLAYYGVSCKHVGLKGGTYNAIAYALPKARIIINIDPSDFRMTRVTSMF